MPAATAPRTSGFEVVALHLALMFGSLGALAADPTLVPPPTRFSLVHEDGRHWLRSPDGRRFLSRGVCVVTPGVSRESYDPENPAYAAWRFGQTEGDWSDLAVRRLRTWGFTTAGAWSDATALERSAGIDLLHTPVLHAGSTAGAPWWDMWDPKVMARIEETARAGIVPLRGNPRVIGYYSDNEMGWWNATLFKMTLEHAPGSGQRRRLVQLLRDWYRDDWQRLRVDFEPEGAEDWAGLEQRGMLFLRPGSEGIRPMRRFLGLMAERYYSLVHDAIRRHAPEALVLGDRYQSFFYPEVAAAAAPYVDAISSNLNVHWNDGTFLRSYLDLLHRLTGKPVFVTEVYLAARRNRSGNRNDSGTFPVVDTQGERAAALGATLAGLSRLPYVVGIDWFQYSDEPTHGRGDGENFNFGLVDIHDQPYEEVTATWTAFGSPSPVRPGRPARRDRREARRDSSLDRLPGLPPAPREPLADLRPNLALKHWDRDRGFVPAKSAEQVADLYACWSGSALYLGLYFVDIIEPGYYRDRTIPKIDRAQWVVTVPGREEPIRARIGAGREPLINEPAVRIETLSGTDLNVRCVAVMEIPARLLGQPRLRSGDVVTWSARLETHARAYRVAWEGTFRLGR